MREVVVTLDSIIWSQALAHGTSAQKAELIAFIQALQGKRQVSNNLHQQQMYIFNSACTQCYLQGKGTFNFSWEGHKKIRDPGLTRNHLATQGGGSSILQGTSERGLPRSNRKPGCR